MHHAEANLQPGKAWAIRLCRRPKGFSKGYLKIGGRWRENERWLDERTIGSFNDFADENRVGCRTLINLYLRDCAASGKKLKMPWASSSRTA